MTGFVVQGHIYSADFVLFDSMDGNGAYSQMFYAIFQFCTEVKYTALDGNPATVSFTTVTGDCVRSCRFQIRRSGYSSV